MDRVLIWSKIKTRDIKILENIVNYLRTEVCEESDGKVLGSQEPYEGRKR